MTNPIINERLKKISRLSSVLMAFGAVVIIGALWLSYDQLYTLQTEVRSLETEAQRLQVENSELNQRAESMRNDIRSLREALSASRNAIIAFHQNDHDLAVNYYDQALHADPNNAYILNLKAYSLFKLDRYQDAINVQNQSIRIDPDYAWGYFDLARFQCALGRFDEARVSIEIALEMRPGLRNIINQDHEFQRLCESIIE